MALPRWCLASMIGVVGMAGTAGADLQRARETRCEVTVRLAGPIATVTELHELVAASPADADGSEAIYTFALPPGAAVTDARVTPPGGREARAIAISRDAIETETPDAQALGIAPDLGLVRWLGGDGTEARYEARAAPLDVGRPLRLGLTWVAAAAFADGQLVLRVPARGDEAALARCDVTVHAKPGAGVRGFGPAFVNGVKVASTGGRTAVAPARGLEVELVPTWSSAGPVAATAAVAAGGGRTLTTVAVYVPPPRGQARFAPARLVVLVDTSRSLGADGRAATAAIVDALVGAVPARTPVEVVAFDRTARRLLGTWRPAREARGAIAHALAAQQPGGGSDLGEALNLAATVVADGESTAVVAITDGVLPTRMAGADLVGHAMMPVSQVTLDVIVPLVPGAPLLGRGPLDELATTFHGQVIAVRTSELGKRASKLPAMLASGAPLRDLVVTLDGDPISMTFPDELPPGDGAVVHGIHVGPVARKVQLTGARSAAMVAFTAVALPPGTAPLAILDAGGDGGALDEAELLPLGRAHGLVTPVTGLAILDTATRTGAARADLARSAGIFTRTSPPGGRPEGVEAAAAAAAVAPEADYNLPASTYQYLIKYQLWPQVRACYQDALRGKPRFAGTLDLTLELARGEVHDVRIGGSRFPEEFIACVAAGAHAIEVPAYPLDGLAETIAIVHKPIYLRAPADADGEGELSDELGIQVAEPPAPPLD